MIGVLTHIFGSLFLLALVAAGFVMMFSPEAGKRLLKNTILAIFLFILGSMIFSMCCARHQ